MSTHLISKILVASSHGTHSLFGINIFNSALLEYSSFWHYLIKFCAQKESTDTDLTPFVTIERH